MIEVNGLDVTRREQIFWISVNVPFFVLFLTLGISFVCLFFSLKSKLATEKKLQGLYKYKEYEKSERVFTCVVIL